MHKTKPTQAKVSPSVAHDDAVVEMFRVDPAFAAEFLNQVLADGDQKELLIAMRRIAAAFGGVPELARRTKLHAKTLYRTLSPAGNPELKSLTALLGAMNLRITVAPLESPVKATRRRAIVARAATPVRSGPAPDGRAQRSR